MRAPSRPALAQIEEPAAGLPDPAQYVGIHQRISAILARGQHRDIKINFGGACGAPSLYPTAALRTATARALRRYPDLFGTAAEADGHPSLRAALARHALRSRIQLAPEDVVVTHGCTEALNLALRAVAKPGDVIAVESPTYYGLLQILEGLGMRALEIPCSPQTGISLEALELAAQTYDNIKAVAVVPNLQNPLGCVMPDAHKQRLVAWCEARGIALIEDDSCAATYEGETPLAAAKTWDTTGNVIHCASLHKVLAPGMRLGWIAAGKWQARVEMLKFGLSRPNEMLCADRRGRFHGHRRVRAPSAPPARAVAHPARMDGAGRGGQLSGRHAAHPAARRAAPVDRAAGRDVVRNRLRAGIGPWHPGHAGLDVLEFEPLRSLSAAQLRQSARAGARTRVGSRGRRGASAGTDGALPSAPPRPGTVLARLPLVVPKWRRPRYACARTPTTRTRRANLGSAPAASRLDDDYQTLFQLAPVSLWLEDFSAVRLAFDQLRADGVTDLRAYLRERPAEVARCSA